MARIFINYRREDGGDITGRLQDRLVPVFGHNQVFRDVTSIPQGSIFQEHIEQSVRTADVMLVAIGPRWTAPGANGRPRLTEENDFVRAEIRQALSRGIPVIPVLSGTEMPSPADVPSDIRSLLSRQAHRLRPDPDFHRDVSELIDRIQVELQENQTEHSGLPVALACPGIRRSTDSAIHQNFTALCGGALTPVTRQTLLCASCATKWTSTGGVQNLLVDGLVQDHDRWLAASERPWAPLWDWLVKTTMDANRAQLVGDLRLDELRWQASGRSPRILDVGAATAMNLRFVARSLRTSPPAELWALDLEPHMLRQALSHAHALRPHRLFAVAADAHRLPFSSACFDRVVCTGCDFANWETVISELERVCRPGGIVCISNINWNGGGSMPQRMAHRYHHYISARARTPPQPRQWVGRHAARLRDEQINESFWMVTYRV